jgi:hypothetical protein
MSVKFKIQILITSFPFYFLAATTVQTQHAHTLLKNTEKTSTLSEAFNQVMGKG